MLMDQVGSRGNKAVKQIRQLVSWFSSLPNFHLFSVYDLSLSQAHIFMARVTKPFSYTWSTLLKK